MSETISEKQKWRRRQRVMPLGEDGMKAIRRIRETGQMSKVNEVGVDVFTASALIAVHDALSPEAQEKLRQLPVSKAAEASFKLLHKRTLAH